MSSCRNLDFSVPGTILPGSAEPMQKSQNKPSQLVRAPARAPVSPAAPTPLCFNNTRMFYTVTGEMVSIDFEAARK